MESMETHHLDQVFLRLFFHVYPISNHFPVISFAIWHPDRLITSTASSLAVLCVLALAAWPALRNPKKDFWNLRKAARLFRSLNFPCAATASTCEDSPCFQVFGVNWVNLFHVIEKTNSSHQCKRFVSRFGDLRHACWSSRTAVYCPWWWLCRPSWWSSFCPSSSQWWWSQKRFLSTMWWANASLICFCFLRSWDGKLVSSKSLHLFTSSVRAWFFCYIFKFMFSIQVSYRSIGVLIQGYAVDYSLHMVTLSAQLRKQCHHISMFGKWMLDIRLSFSPEPLNPCPSTIITTWMFLFSFDVVVSTGIPTLVTEDLQYMVADIGSLYFSRWEFWRTFHRRCAKVYKYGSNDALAEDDPIDLGQSWQGQHVIRNAWCERLRGKVLLQEPFKLWLCSLLWICWPHGWKLSGQGKEKSSQRLQRMSFALKTMGGATVGSAITTAGLSWITRACNSG